MVFSRNACKMASSHPWTASKSNARAAVAVFFFLVEAIWGSVASFAVSEAASPTEITTWTEHTGRQSRQCCGSSTHEGRAIAESHRGSGRQRVCGSTVVGDKKTRRAAQERPLAMQVEECQGFIQRSRNRLNRMEQERIAENKELDAALVRLTRLHEEMTRAAPPKPKSQSWRRRERSSARSAHDPFPSLRPTCLGRRSKVWFCSSVRLQTKAL